MSRNTSKIIGILGLVLIGVVVFGLMDFNPKSYFQQFRNTETLRNKIGCRLYDLNTLEISSEEDIDWTKVVVKNNNQIIAIGKNKIGDFKQEYGYQKLEIYYDHLLVSEIFHFKRNNWYTNDYTIKLAENNGEVKVNKYQVEGPDGSNDSFRKDFIYDKNKELIKIEWYNLGGSLYNTSKPNEE